MTASIPADTKKKMFSGRILDSIILILLVLGIFVMPIHMRSPIIDTRDNSYSFLNFPASLAVLLSFIRFRKLRNEDIVLMIVWILSSLTIFISDIKWSTAAITCVCNNLLPVFLVLYRMDEGSRSKTIRGFLVFFDLFVCLLLILAIVERTTDHSVIKAFVAGMAERGFNCKEMNSLINSGTDRFYNVWGHPLTNALLFTAFFILNDVYFTVTKQKHPIVSAAFFVVAMAGVLLCQGKMAIIVLGLYLIIANLKNWKLLLLCLLAAVALYFSGVMNSLIQRFQTGSLSTGRIPALTKYLKEWEYPLQFLVGYGTSAVYTLVYDLRAGFEFPLLMFSMDFGILFSFLTLFVTYFYVSWRLLKQKAWKIWFAYTLLYCQTGVYNAYALRNQDVCYIMNLFTLLILSCAEMNRPSSPKTLEPRS